MEQLRKSDRSSSDGSPHWSYSASSLPQQRSGPLHLFLRPPLRSVNENSLLISPGPLESMLKKTTETGDIGIFSIRPPRPSIAYHAPRPTTRGGGGDPIWRNDRRRLPLYRDTASEIISMYGSDSQRSVSSSLSMPFDESGRRSYSMTSCSSKPLPHQRSNGTLQSQASGNLLQRPCSPFPYPTRLKRPGIRPSSPAVTENGRVDYSRVGGINRVSSRTVYGSYGPNPTPHGCRAAPRYGCLNAYNSGRFSSRHESSSASQYSRGGSSTAPAGQGGRHTAGFVVSMAEQRGRTSSGASMTDIYRSPSCTQSIRSCPRLSQASGAFYYDYSEDFEDRPAPAATNPVPPRAPLAPIPTRAPSARRASVLNDGFDSCFQVPSGSDLAVTRRQPHSPVKPYRDQTEPGDQRMSSHPPQYNLPEDGYGEELHSLSETHQTNFNTSNVERSPSLRRWFYGQPTGHQQEQIGGRTERSAPKRTAVSVFGSDNSEQENHPIPNGRPEMRLVNRSRPKERSSSPKRLNLGAPSTIYTETGPISALTFRSDKSEACSIEPGLADLVSFVPYLDKAAEWGNEDKIGTAVIQVGSGTNLACDAPPYNVPRGDDNMPYSARVESTDKPHRSFSGFRGHRRNLAVPAIRTSQIPKELVVPTSSEDGDTTRRQGPTTKLRAKASIPLLLKSLPPFPTGSKSEPCTNDSVVGHVLPYPPRDEMGAFEIGQNHPTEPMNTASRATESWVRPTNYTASAIPERTSSREDYCNPRPFNGKLKLRVSRAALVKAHARARPSIGQFEGPENFQISGDFDQDFHPSRTEGYQKQDEGGGGLLLENQDQRLSATDGSKAHSLDGSAVLGDARTSLSGRTSTSIQAGRGLKKRVSDLCVRLAGSGIRSIKGDGASSNAESFPGHIGNTVHEKREDDPSRPSHTSHRQLGRLGGRSSRWLRAARHAVMVACAGPRKH